MPWYAFTPLAPLSYPDDPNQYTLIGATPPACPGANNFLCAIQAADNLGQPIITAALLEEMGTALENYADSTNVLLKP